MDASETEKRMQALRVQYQIRLLRQLGEMRDLAAQLDGGEADHAIYRALHGQLHKLAGSGGTFGFPELSRRSLRLESLLDDWLSEGPPRMDASMRRQFLSDLHELASLRE